MAQVSLICKRTVVSTKPVVPGKFSALSVLDRVMERNHLRVVFYYNLQKKRDAGELTRKLRESISEMLTAFPLVVGRLLRNQEGHWMIKCNDAGLRMVETRVNTTVDLWLQNLDREKELKLIHWEEMSTKPYFWSPFYVQITEFEDGGLAIGLSCTHLLADPICAAMMISAWAETTLRGEILQPPFFHPLPRGESINYQESPLINHYRSTMRNPATIYNATQTTLTFEFNQEMVKSCITMATIATSQDDEKTPTPFEALASLFWTCISKLKGTNGALIGMSIALDMREVLHLGKRFFGNCMVYNRVEVEDGSSDCTEMSNAATLVRKAVSRMEYNGLMNLFEWLEREDMATPPLMNGSCLICANLESAESYSAIFEDHASPVHVSYYIEPAIGPGQVLIFRSPGSHLESRVVEVTLSQDEAEKLVEDTLIKRFAPTILTGFNRRVRVPHPS